PVVSLGNNETAGGQFNNAFPGCVGDGAGTSNALWFEFTPAASGKYEFTTCGSSLYLVLSLWKGPRCGPYTAVEGGCSSSAPANSSCAGISKASAMTVQAAAGETLRLIGWGCYGGGLGAYTVAGHSLMASITGARGFGK